MIAMRNSILDSNDNCPSVLLYLTGACPKPVSRSAALHLLRLGLLGGEGELTSALAFPGDFLSVFTTTSGLFGEGGFACGSGSFSRVGARGKGGRIRHVMTFALMCLYS